MATSFQKDDKVISWFSITFVTYTYNMVFLYRKLEHSLIYYVNMVIGLLVWNSLNLKYTGVILYNAQQNSSLYGLNKFWNFLNSC